MNKRKAAQIFWAAFLFQKSVLGFCRKSKKFPDFQTELVHAATYDRNFAVNNTRLQVKNRIDFIDLFGLFTGFSQACFGEQAVHINSLKELKYLLECSQFIERTKRAVESKIKVVRFQDNPARAGKS